MQIQTQDAKGKATKTSTVVWGPWLTPFSTAVGCASGERERWVRGLRGSFLQHVAPVTGLENPKASGVSRDSVWQRNGAGAGQGASETENSPAPRRGSRFPSVTFNGREENGQMSTLGSHSARAREGLGWFLDPFRSKGDVQPSS